MEITVKAEMILRDICKKACLSYENTIKGITYLLLRNQTKSTQTIIIPISDKLFDFDIKDNEVTDID